MESRRHSAKVSNDLKDAVFEAAERIVGGFLADVRSRPEDFSTPPSAPELRDAGFPLGEIAVFYRVNGQSRVIETALRNAGVNAHTACLNNRRISCS